jgi:hypothetical protein
MARERIPSRILNYEPQEGKQETTSKQMETSDLIKWKENRPVGPSLDDNDYVNKKYWRHNN